MNDRASVSSFWRPGVHVRFVTLRFMARHARRHLPPQVTPVNNPALKAIRPPTSGPWYDVVAADRWRREVAAPTVKDSPMLYLLDLHGVHPTVEVLDAYLRQLASDMKAGTYGESAIVVSTPDKGVKRYVQMVAAQEDLPIYVSDSTTTFALMQAEPGASLTETERQTLRIIMNLGGVVDSRDVANALHLQHTTAVNRLNALAEKGLLFRRKRAGRTTDLYVDFRIASADYGFATLESALADTSEPGNGRTT